MPGVERRMLDRIGDEVARATSVVRYAPGSRFSAHTHGGGEEFLVLEGVFSDESGDYPAGTYVRNPIGTSHAPHNTPGATILVKLHQFDRADTVQKAVDTSEATFAPTATDGARELLLHTHGTERVSMQRWDAGTTLPLQRFTHGAEYYVVDGEFADAEGSYPRGTWLRLPPNAEQVARTATGCLLWLKTGHLTDAALARSTR